MRIPAFAAPLAAVLIWSGNTVASKAAATAIDPATITFYRWLLAFVLLVPFAGPGAWRKRAEIGRHWPRLALLGVLGMATYQGLAYVAALTASATSMGVILGTMPLMACLFAAMLAAERLRAWQVAGAMLSLAGLAVVVTGGHPATLAAGLADRGDGIMLVAVASNALYGVLLKRWPSTLTLWEQLFVQIGFGLVVLLPFWLVGPMTPIDARNAGLILYATLGASLAAPVLWMVGVRQFGAARATQFVNLVPLFVALMAATMLGEALRWYHLVGGGVVLAGVVLALRPVSVSAPRPGTPP